MHSLTSNATWARGVDKTYGSVSSRCYGVNTGGLCVPEPPHYTFLLPEVSCAVDELILSTHMEYAGGLEQLETQ
jgi:hypothetical protein